MDEDGFHFLANVLLRDSYLKFRLDPAFTEPTVTTQSLSNISCGWNRFFIVIEYSLIKSWLILLVFCDVSFIELAGIG